MKKTGTRRAMRREFLGGLTFGLRVVGPVLLARGLAIVIGVCGIVLTGLVAALAVEALSSVRDKERRE